MSRRKSKGRMAMTQVDSNTAIVTSEAFDMTDYYKAFRAAYDPVKSIYSNVVLYESSTNELTLSRIEELSRTALSNVDDAITVNDLIRAASNSDDVIGMVVQAVRNNINTDYKVEYNTVSTKKITTNKLKKVKELIDDFNRQVNLREVIRQAIELPYMEGTYVAYLRKNDTNWEIDHIPLGIAEISSFKKDGEPMVLFNVGKLRDTMDGDILKNRKGQALFFKTVDEIVKNTYPKEVYEAYRTQDEYVVLNPEHTATVRVNNCGKKYGLSPVFRALSSKVMIDTLKDADVVAAKSKSKKIIHQVLREKLMDGGMRSLKDMTFAHEQLVAAFRNQTVLYTSPACVDRIEYIEPKAEDISTDKTNFYRNQELASLGVSFLSPDGEMTSTVASINLEQLLKMINAIAEQVSHMLTRFYRFVLAENGYGEEYVPSVHVLDAQMMDANMRIELSKFVYNVLGASRKTAFALAGLNVNDEAETRRLENEQNLKDIFTPYLTSYVTNGDTESGRPPDDGNQVQDPDKKAYDQEYNRNVRE